MKTIAIEVFVGVKEYAKYNLPDDAEMVKDDDGKETGRKIVSTQIIAEPGEVAFDDNLRAAYAAAGIDPLVALNGNGVRLATNKLIREKYAKKIGRSFENAMLWVLDDENLEFLVEYKQQAKTDRETAKAWLVEQYVKSQA